MKRLKTLRVRFALWTAGLLLVAFVLFGLFVYENMSRGLATVVDEALQLTAMQLIAEADLRDGELVFNENPIEDTQPVRFREQGLSTRIVNRAGQLVQEYGPYRALPEPNIDFSDPNYPGQFTTLIDLGSQDRVRVYTTAIVEANEVVGTLQVAQNLNNISRTLNLLLITMLISGPLIVIVAGGGGYLLAAHTLTSIDKITRTARLISSEDLSARLNLPTAEDEVGRLAATFDSMLARLEDGFRRERQFTADASHELRTPLAAIQTIIGSTLARERTGTEYKQAFIDLNREARQIRTLIEGLLQLARNDATQQPAKFEWVDLAILLKDVGDSLRPLAEDKGLQLIDQVSAEGLTLLGDSDGLIRLFVNLIDNAVKYTEQGFITIAATRQADRWLVVTIRDTGVGIAPEHLPHIFDRFYRVDEARSKEGIGLGLAIAQNIAHAHGGNITVESEVGKGTTFVVQLSAK